MDNASDNSNAIINEYEPMSAYVFHYAFEKPAKLAIEQISNGFLHFEPLTESIKNELKHCDPVVLFQQHNEKYKIISGDINFIPGDTDKITVKLDCTICKENQRAYKRYPTSFLCDVREVYSRKINTALLKDISNYGMLIYSREEYMVGDTLEICLYIGTIMYFAEGIIVRRAEDEKYIKYGLMVRNTDISSLRDIKAFLRAHHC